MLAMASAHRQRRTVFQDKNFIILKMTVQVKERFQESTRTSLYLILGGNYFLMQRMGSGTRNKVLAVKDKILAQKDSWWSSKNPYNEL